MALSIHGLVIQFTGEVPNDWASTIDARPQSWSRTWQAGTPATWPQERPMNNLERHSRILKKIWKNLNVGRVSGCKESV